MFSSTKTSISTGNFSERRKWLIEQIAQADCVLIGAGAGLTTAAGIDYAGEDFRREFREWIDRYGITDLYSAGFYPFKTEEERWALWAKHIWFSRYRTGALPLYKRLLKLVDDKDYFVITTNVDGQFEMAGFDAERIFATQGDYCFFQPASGSPKELYYNKEWVERALPAIHDCRIPTELIPHTPSGKPVSMNLRCDDTFVEDSHWHRQAKRYNDFVYKASDKSLLLLEFGVGFNTPGIIRFPFEHRANGRTITRYHPRTFQPRLSAAIFTRNQKLRRYHRRRYKNNLRQDPSLPFQSKVLSLVPSHQRFWKRILVWKSCFYTQPRQLLVHSRTLGQHTWVDIVEQPRAERSCLSPFVIDTSGRHVPMPPCIEEEFPLGVSI